jgi:hypothetical protein
MQAGGKKGYMVLHYDTDDNLTFQKANGMGFSMQKGEKRTNEYTQKKNNSSHDIHRSFGLHQTSVEYNHHLILNKRCEGKGYTA